MEDKDELNGSGFSVKGDEGPQTYRVPPIVENPGGHFDGSTDPPPPAAAAPPSVEAPAPSTDLRKKRGRPRKYSGDGSAVALSPMPISASIPFTTGDYTSAWKNSSSRPVGTFKKKHKLKIENPGKNLSSQPPRCRVSRDACMNHGQPLAYSLGGSFIPHMLTVNTGEDIMMKVISFSQQGSQAICILAAHGTISNVTLRQSTSSGGTLTYEGCFEILSLTGSFMPSDNGVTKSRSGGMSVSLAGPDGRVLGGGLAGMLVAAGPVQIVIGSFPLPGPEQEERKRSNKKPNYEQTISFTPIDANPISEHRYEALSFNGPKPNLTTSPHFNTTNVNSAHDPKITENPEQNFTFASGGDSREPSHELSC